MNGQMKYDIAKVIIGDEPAYDEDTMLIEWDDHSPHLEEGLDARSIRNIETVAITNNADSTLAKLVRKHISAYVQRIQFAGYDLSARSTLVVLIDILVEFFMKKR
ncbi:MULTISPECIES: putative regulator [Geobacillus]|uniref:putative regulator n=1 Tax=Geobacillus TaxID=129337 RepID=UPI0002AF343A|nr:putative regulator [Geobacillus sp. GHH01]AGE23843.1 putative regulator [Geobacillus sp. GHH01]WJQ00191.1 hypothetical protein QT234_16635 [Geobacillus stearothermophilus]WJQ03581.1 hypothetical protein QT236_16630 [Geobacillus stearothermophilus]